MVVAALAVELTPREEEGLGHALDALLGLAEGVVGVLVDGGAARVRQLADGELPASVTQSS